MLLHLKHLQSGQQGLQQGVGGADRITDSLQGWRAGVAGMAAILPRGRLGDEAIPSDSARVFAAVVFGTANGTIDGEGRVAETTTTTTLSRGVKGETGRRPASAPRPLPERKKRKQAFPEALLGWLRWDPGPHRSQDTGVRGGPWRGPGHAGRAVRSTRSTLPAGTCVAPMQGGRPRRAVECVGVPYAVKCGRDDMVLVGGGKGGGGEGRRQGRGGPARCANTSTPRFVNHTGLHARFMFEPQRCGHRVRLGVGACDL